VQWLGSLWCETIFRFNLCWLFRRPTTSGHDSINTTSYTKRTRCYFEDGQDAMKAKQPLAELWTSDRGTGSSMSPGARSLQLTAAPVAHSVAATTDAPVDLVGLRAAMSLLRSAGGSATTPSPPRRERPPCTVPQTHKQ
jgi:hypothetical protein